MGTGFRAAMAGVASVRVAAVYGAASKAA